MEAAVESSAASHDVKSLSKHEPPIIRRDYMDLDEFLKVASNFDSDKEKLGKERKKMNYHQHPAFAGSIYNSLLTHINSVQGMRGSAFYSDKMCSNGYGETQAERSHRLRDRADLYHSDDSSNDGMSRDCSDSSRMERVSQAVSVIVNDAKDADDSDSGGDSNDSGFGTKPCSPGDEGDGNGRDGGGKSKSRRRRKSEYIYNPLPVGRKSTRKFVPTDKKDDRYWEQRIKNNIAAKRSREARRQKEMEILNRCQALVNENDSLKEINERLTNKVDELERRLELYNKVVSNDNVVLVKV